MPQRTIQKYPLLKLLFAKGAITPRNYRFYVVTNYGYSVGMALHLFFIPLFAYLGVTELAIFNIISAIAFFSCVSINRKGRHNLALIIVSIKVCLHTILAIYLLGWSSGFFIYLLALVPLFFFNPMWSNTLKIALSVLVTILYLNLKLLSGMHPAVYALPIEQINQLYYLNSACIFLVLAFLSYSYSLAVQQTESALQKSYSQIQHLAQTDPLTKLSNRRDTFERIESEVVRCKRNGKPFAIVLADIDNFKQFNDQHGHDCGDFVLIAAANTIKNMLRENDHIGRWGGEEFMILLPDTASNDAKVVSEKIRRTLNDKKYTFNNIECNITMTFGIGIYDGKSDIVSSIGQADKALNKGKQNGKNCVTILS